MPVDVDSSQRLDAIASATIAVAKESGARAVTIRTVAGQLGGSTTVVTHYVRNRADLMANAARFALSIWRREMAARLDGLAGRERLLAFARYWTTTTPDDRALRSLWIEMLSMNDPDSIARDAVREEAKQERLGILELLLGEDVPDPERAADILYLLLRGFLISSVEDPEDWPAERVADAASTVLRLLAAV
jgi:AcrR family transcriptional regulator